MRRPRHQAVAAVLAQMDASALRGARCWFGGGTRIVLDIDEYRVSADPLARAATAFRDPERAEYRRRCLSGLDVDAPEPLLDGVRKILADLGRAPA
jgi:hypothetical protein